ncbi:MAG TPA: endonuclease/exonuclease/phosphatase family protein [Bacteroidales bacterium]|nr:endonuclease/exonuclease/phosphatase family protein [Bacteroidales bacterium]
MKKRIFLIISMCIFGILSNAQILKVATYNLRNDNLGDSLNKWTDRCPVIADLISFYDFDIFGTQEGLINQLTDLKTKLSDYNYIGVGRDDGASGGEHSAIFYHVKRFKLLDKGDFWLSAVSDKPNKGWDADCKRICSWGKFEDLRSRKVFYFFNVHFDHRGKQARIESVKLMKEKIETIAGKSAVILTGDFNFNENNENYNQMQADGKLKDAYLSSPVRFAPQASTNDFNVNSKQKGRIDHIFLTSDFQVKRYAILSHIYNGKFPSDHFPVCIETEFVTK